MYDIVFMTYFQYAGVNKNWGSDAGEISANGWDVQSTPSPGFFLLFFIVIGM